MQRALLLAALWSSIALWPPAASASIPYLSCFKRSATDHALSENLLVAVSATESNWNANARSHANAHGLMQIQWPGTAKHLGVRRVSDLYKPCTNIELGARYLRELLDRFEGDEARALAAYNYGPGRIGKAKPLPKGALRYIQTVRRHQKRIQDRVPATSTAAVIAASTPAIAAGAGAGAGAGAIAAASAVSQTAVLMTNTRAGAQRYVRALNRQVDGAVFSFARQDGRYAILMTAEAGGLSRKDRTLLKSIGWTAEGTTRRRR